MSTPAAGTTWALRSCPAEGFVLEQFTPSGEPDGSWRNRDRSALEAAVPAQARVTGKVSRADRADLLAAWILPDSFIDELLDHQTQA